MFRKKYTEYIASKLAVCDRVYCAVTIDFSFKTFIYLRQYYIYLTVTNFYSAVKNTNENKLLNVSVSYEGKIGPDFFVQTLENGQIDVLRDFFLFGAKAFIFQNIFICIINDKFKDTSL